MPKANCVTVEELHRRLVYIANQLIDGWHISVVYRYLRSEFRLSTRLCAIYVAKARELVKREIGTTW